MASALALGAVLLGGCGADGGNTLAKRETAGAVAVETGSLSKAQFVNRADAICDEGKNRLDKAFASYGQREVLTPSSSDAEKAEWAEKLLSNVLGPEWEGEIEEIGSLGAPTPDQSEIASFLAKFQRNLHQLEAHPVSFFEQSPFSETTQAARAYGLDGCAKSLGG